MEIRQKSMWGRDEANIGRVLKRESIGTRKKIPGN
jgi:hypothetical protein